MYLKKFIILFFTLFTIIQANEPTKKIVYIVPDIQIPFWQIMSKGITNASNSLAYELEIYDSKNSPKIELQNTIKSIKNKVAGIVISPTNSSACVTILKLAKKASIPVVISDIGTDGGEYVSYISSNNKDGAYKLGQILAKRMNELNYQDGKVGIIAIPQKRLNGQERTAGFMQALNEAKIKGATIVQQFTWTEEETYTYTKQMILDFPDLRAVWLQSSNVYLGALNAIKDAGKSNEILLISFDAEPIFLDLIPKGILVGAAMQQPYLMGHEALVTMDKYLNKEEVQKNIQLPILDISKENIEQKLPIIRKNVLGLEE
ncbi:MAG: substrate-binding domain-containing protein [Poseidonibacter sp.]|uniref:substrate-binding domain-containing protein n=1 Tax=Poseidonibacter sp. TaxID=2321188 RepID=UPI00359D5864